MYFLYKMIRKRLNLRNVITGVISLAGFTTICLLTISLFVVTGCKEEPNDEDNNGNNGVASKESPDIVDFSDGKIPSVWQANGWEVDNTEGCGDNFSLTPSADKGTLICYKTATDNINGIRFYIKGEGFISFFIDSEKKEECLADANNWTQFNFTFLAGEHEYKWEYSAAKSFQKKSINFSLDSISFGSNINVGSLYQGGIIVCLPENGLPGLIAAPTSFAEKYRWNLCDNGNHEPCRCVVTYAYETAYGKGMENTEKIVKAQGDGEYAAKVCYDLALNGYTDWFLPSSGEYGKMVAVGDRLYFPQDNFGSIGLYHWTSSEDSNPLYARYYAWSGKIGNNGQLTFDSNFQKHGTYYVRAVRYF